MAAEDLNSVALVGRLTRDPEVKYTTSGVAKMSLSIAVNRSVKDNGQWKQEASFFDVMFWGKQAEALNQFLFKGKQIGVTGKLEQQRWTTQEGNKSRIIINADSIQLLGGGEESLYRVKTEVFDFNWKSVGRYERNIYYDYDPETNVETYSYEYFLNGNPMSQYDYNAQMTDYINRTKLVLG